MLPLPHDADAQRARPAVGNMGALATQCGPLSKASASPGQCLEEFSAPAPKTYSFRICIINKSPR